MWTSTHIQAQLHKFHCFQNLALKDYIRKSKQTLSLKSEVCCFLSRRLFSERLLSNRSQLMSAIEIAEVTKGLFKP